MMSMTVAAPVFDEQVERRAYRWFGTLNGVLIGFALAVGVWGPALLTLLRLPVSLPFSQMLGGGLALVLLGGLAGWLSALQDKGWWSLLVWFLTALAMIWVIGHMPYEGHDLLVWLHDNRFRGLSVYLFDPPAQVRMLMTGFFILVLLSILGMLQPYRLETIRAANDTPNRLSGKGWFLLLLPLPFVFAAGLVADNLINQPFRLAPKMVNEVISTGRAYDGDLFQLSLATGVNYNAILGLSEQMQGDYNLQIAELDLTAAQVVMITAHFDNGAWVNCRVVVDPSIAQVTSCYDASQPYLKGFPALFTGESMADCKPCTVRVSDDERAWLRAQGEAWGGAPIVSFVAQEGRHVVMRAASPDRTAAVECLFTGLVPVMLQSCREVAL